MENVQAAISTLPPAPAKTAASDVPVDTDADPARSSFLAVLTQQVKSLKGAPKVGAEGADADAPDAPDANPAQASTDTALGAEPAAIPLPLLAALPPTLVPAHAPAPAAIAAALTAKLPASRNDAQSAADGGIAAALDVARKSGAGNAATTPAHVAPAGGMTAELAARGELLRGAELTPRNATDGRENNAQTVPQLAFAQAFTEARLASPAAPSAQLQLDTALGAAGWSTGLGQQVVWMVGEKQHIAELRVNPPELGPLDIKLTIDDQQTTAVFTSPHAGVRDAVESALPRLREVLAESGIMLGNASVTADSPRDGSAFAPPPRTPPAAGTDSARAAAARLQPAIPGGVRGHGLVDLFA